MFSNTDNGADTSAILYSIIETAKANGLIPFDYMLHYFEHLATGSDDIDAMLPWNIDRPLPDAYGISTCIHARNVGCRAMHLFRDEHH